MRSLQSNKLYHELIGQLHTNKTISVWDGNFINLKMPNPVKLRPSAFNIHSFREIMKALDLEYPRDEKGLVISSAKLTNEQMSSHINFLQCLLSEQ